jgi:hypothetical protein
VSRSGYSDDLDPWSLIRWRGAVASAIRGKRGQAFLADLVRALDALPSKRLIADALEDNGEVCGIGAVALLRGYDVSEVDPYDSYRVSEMFGIAEALAKEVVYVNDEAGTYLRPPTPEQRWIDVRAWAVSCLLPETLVAMSDPVG